MTAKKSSKVTAKQTKATTVMLKAPRRIPVCLGDVFGGDDDAIVVVADSGGSLDWAAPSSDIIDRCGPRRAVVRSANTGRTSFVRTTRLQAEYARASEQQTAATHRLLAKALGLKVKKAPVK